MDTGGEVVGCVTMPPRKKSMPVRLSDEAIRLARIASGFTGESMAEYVSRLVEEKSREIIDRLYGEMKSEESAAPREERRPPKGRGGPKS